MALETEPDVTITFSKANSPVFAKVIKACQRFIGFKNENGVYILPLSIFEIVHNWEPFTFIFLKTEKWVTFEIKIKQKPIALARDRRELFNELAAVQNCLYEKQNSFLPEEHCSNPGWGCRLLKSVGYKMEFFGHHAWYNYGHLSDGKWIVNRDKILTILLNEARLKMAAQCPQFNQERIERAVKRLPAEIDISSKHWQLLTAIELVEGAFRDVPYALQWIGSRENENFLSIEFISKISEIDISNLSKEGIDMLLKNYLKNGID